MLTNKTATMRYGPQFQYLLPLPDPKRKIENSAMFQCLGTRSGGDEGLEAAENPHSKVMIQRKEGKVFSKGPEIIGHFQNITIP